MKMRMKRIAKAFVLVLTMIANANFLLSGCQERNIGHPSQKKNEIQTAASIDTLTLEEDVDEPSPQFEAFHPDSLIGSWQWLHTRCEFGDLSCKVTWCMVLRFEDGNKLSVEFNGENIVDRAKYKLKEAEENPYGEYLITVPEETRKAVFEKVGDLPEAILNGYVSFGILNKGYEMKCLVITDTEGTGRKDLHQSSTFRRVDEAHPARPLRRWSE